MKKWNIYLVLSCAVLLWNACLDEIDIDPAQRPETGYVIQGKLVMGTPAIVEVKVERMFVYSSNINQAVSDAVVTLVSEEDVRFTIPGTPLNGVYQANLDPSVFPVAEGKRYRVEVRLSTGDEIVSDWDQVVAAPPKGTLSWQFDEIETESADGLVSLVPAISFFVDSPLWNSAGEKAQLRWEFIDAYRITDNLSLVCYVENPYQAGRALVLDGTAIAGDTVKNYPLLKDRIGRKVVEGYYLTAYQQALSPESFSYWEEIASLLEREGTVFDNPAGRISTNMRNTQDSTALVFGFFSAFQQDTMRLYLSPEDMGNPDAYCPRPSNGQPMPPITICDNCIDATGASYNKPFYWEE